jgi:hypothetical protein
MYRLSVAAAHEAVSDDRYTALAAEGQPQTGKS